MTRKHQLDGLKQLSGLQFRAAQAEMAELLRRESALRQNLEQLIQSKSRQVQASRPSDDAALIAAADIRWHQWVDQRRATINTELAQILALKENCRVKLKRAFGRDQVTQTLHHQTVQSQKRALQRKQDYES